VIFLNSKLGPNEYPYIVAEISCNHEGDLAKAKLLIEAAKDSGANAVKIQVYTADDMTYAKPIGDSGFFIDKSNRDFIIQSGPWKDQHLYNLYQKTQTDFELAKQMMIYANQVGIDCFASVFSKESIDWLETEMCPAYKIASFEITDLELIKYAAKTNKPIILSTGMCSIPELNKATECVDPHNSILLHCVSAYPTKISEANLWRIRHLGGMYPFFLIGFSDHTRGVMAGPLAVAAGARMLEKHLALEHTHPEDEHFSLHPGEFKTYVQRCRIAAEAMFDSEVIDEASSIQFRRSIYVVKDIKEGEFFTQENIRVIRPSYGLHGHLYKSTLGKKTTKDIKAGTALKTEHIK